MKKEVKYLLGVLIGVIVISFFGFKLFLQDKAQTKVADVPSYPMMTNLVTLDSFSYGPVDAKVTVIEFFDPECESCAAVSPYIKNEMKHYEGKVRWIFRYMPYHFNSKLAIAALESARQQNLYLEAMDLLFKHQPEWGEKQVSAADEINKLVLSLPQINKDKYLKDFNNPEIQNMINRDQAEGKQAGVKGTPTFFVNGMIIDELNLDTLISRINAGLGQ
jgi:protein-disulfide isomerase